MTTFYTPNTDNAHLKNHEKKLKMNSCKQNSRCKITEPNDRSRARVIQICRGKSVGAVTCSHKR